MIFMLGASEGVQKFKPFVN